MVFPDTYTQSETDTLLAHKVSTTGNVSLSGNLNFGVGASASTIKAYATHDGNTGYIEVYESRRGQCYLNCITNLSYGTRHLTVNDVVLMRCTRWDDQVNIYKDTAVSKKIDVGSTTSLTVK